MDLVKTVASYSGMYLLGVFTVGVKYGHYEAIIGSFVGVGLILAVITIAVLLDKLGG